MEIFYLEISFSTIEISRQFCASWNSFYTEKIQLLRRSLPHVLKLCGSLIYAQLYDRVAFSFLLEDASTDEAENELSVEYQLGLWKACALDVTAAKNNVRLD